MFLIIWYRKAVERETIKNFDTAIGTDTSIGRYPSALSRENALQKNKQLILNLYWQYTGRN